MYTVAHFVMSIHTIRVVTAVVVRIVDYIFDMKHDFYNANRESIHTDVPCGIICMCHCFYVIFLSMF